MFLLELIKMLINKPYSLNGIWFRVWSKRDILKSKMESKSRNFLIMCQESDQISRGSYMRAHVLLN